MVIRGLRSSSTDKHQDHHVVTRNKKFDYEIRGAKLKSVQCVKDLGDKIASNLKFLQQYIDAARKANRTLGFIKRIFIQDEDIILLLYNCIDLT